MKQLIAFILAFTLCFSNVVYADGISGGSSAGQGDGNIGDATSSSGNGTWKLPGNTGFRFTIVDASGNPVANILGSGIGSLDVINSGVKWNTGEIWKSCATAPSQGMNDYFIQPISMSKFLELIGESGHNFRWIDSNENLYGDEVREFILKGTKTIGGLDGSVDKGNQGGSVDGATTSPAEATALLNSWRKIFDNWVEQSKDISNKDKVLDAIKTKSIALKADFPKLPGLNQWTLLGDFNTAYTKILNNFGMDAPPDIDYFRWKDAPAAYEEYLKYINGTKQASNKKSGLDLFHLFGGLTAYAAPADNNSGSSGIGDTSLMDSTSVLAKIINLQINGNYVFQLEGSAKTVSEKDSGAPSPLITFTEKNYVLLVEATIQGCPQGWNTKTDSAGVSYKSLVYGTAHNWANFGVSSSFKNSSAYSPSFGNHKRYLGQALPNSLVTVSDWSGVLLQPQKSGQYKIADMQSLFNTGYGCHLYTTIDLLQTDIPDIIIPENPGDGGGSDFIHTYDITTNPKVDYFTEPSKDKNESDSYGSKKNKFNVVKYYIYEDSITNEVTEISYYVTQNAPHKVIIDDEKAQTGFSLKEYFTSTDTWLPENNKSPSDYKWTDVKAKHKNGTYSGADYTTVTVTPENPDNVLHILYTFTGKEAVNIVKVYKNANNEIIKTTGPEVAEDSTKYTVTEESDYDYVETLISTSDPDTENPNGSSTKDKEIIIPSGTKTLYIIYKEPVKQIKLFSNELSYTYDLRDLVKSRILFEIYDIANSAPGISPSCGGHSCGGSGDNCPHYYYCSRNNKTLPDSMWTLSVTDLYDYESTGFIRDYELSNTKKSGHASWSGGQKAGVKTNATFLLFRDKNADLVTLYPHKNDNLLSDLSNIGLGQEGYSPAGGRIESETVKDKDFTRTLNTHFDYAEDRDDKLKWKWVLSGSRGSHTNSDSYLIEAKTTPENANKYYSNQNNVKEYYLLGQSNTGSEDISDMRSDAFGSKYSYNKAYSSTSSDLKFYPYHLMLYRAKNSNANAQNVYVTSENLSTMKVYNAVQTGVYKKNPINALLSSTQWSTHARSLAFSGNSDKRSVIAGGGILDISLGNKGDTQLGIRLWQSCLRDEMVETVQADSFNTSLSKAKEVANSYKEEVKTVLSGYGLVQWGTEGINTDLNSVLSGVELHNNTSLDWDNRSYKTSGDSKYYLKHDSQGSDRANFDVLDSKITKQVFYEVSSDVDGNVILKKDNTEIARATMNQDKSSILSNAEAKLLDDNTKLVSNYFSSIDRGLGDSNKYDRTNSRKYNEAFDGVGVLMTELSFDVGFSSNSGHRTTVLDTLLTSTSESKSDLYNFDESKVRSFVFATTKTSTTATDTSKNGYIGTLSGDSTMGSLSSVLSDIQSFVYTKNFYTSNFNVTDLN